VLVKRGRCWSIVDLNATNGTRVNGERVHRRRLRPGDQIELGRRAVLAVTGERRLR
jgi:pSer/pThr/pTyr-binding forkhead associated (FHA) protein